MLERRVEFLPCLGRAAGAKVEHAQLDVRVGVVGVELERLAVVFQRVVGLAASPRNDTPDLK